MWSSVARGLPKTQRWSDTVKVGIALAANPKVSRRLIALTGLSPSMLSSLRPARTGWELQRQEFRAVRRTISGASWTKHQLQQDASLAAPSGYQHAKHPQRTQECGLVSRERRSLIEMELSLAIELADRPPTARASLS
jgi:hypothetical protein